MGNRYKDPRWSRKRATVLRRDEYLCRECRRYGKTTAATTVHHIYPAEDYPQWWLESWNLISLCTEHANAMHDRQTDKLTELGLAWQERVYPPG
jgi:5-methylcytosine-specific restriction endonuclease McrA